MCYRHDEIGEAHKRTFEWVQDDPGPGFVSWLRQSHGIFWIRGKPASGKSTLMKLIYDDSRTRRTLEATHGVETLLVAGFFFHDRGSFLQKSLHGVLQAILYQILKRFRELIPMVFPVATQEEEENQFETRRQRHWSHQELERALRNLVGQSQVAGNVCLFIDALNEYNGGHLEFVELIKTMAASTSDATLKIRFCISSRSLNVFMDGFKDCPGFQIHKWTERDISTYVTSRFQEHPRLRARSCGNEELSLDADNIGKEVVRRALGVFLWVKLVVDDLLEGLTDGDTTFELQERLAAVPDDLEGLYRQILKKIHRSYLPDAFHFFDIVRSAVRPLTLLQFALAAEPLAAAMTWPLGEMEASTQTRLCSDMERRLGSRCRGLLELQVTDIPQNSLWAMNHCQAGRRTTVQFLHQTVKDFLRNPENRRHNSGIQDANLTHDPYLSLLGGTFRELISFFDDRQYNRLERAAQKSWYYDRTQIFLAYAKKAELSTGKPQTELLDELSRAESLHDKDRPLHPYCWPL